MRRRFGQVRDSFYRQLLGYKYIYDYHIQSGSKNRHNFLLPEVNALHSHILIIIHDKKVNSNDISNNKVYTQSEQGRSDPKFFRSKAES
jgi:hypothetical protein